MASVIMFALLMLLIIFVEHSQLECPPSDYSGSSGYIVSPNFPDVYDNNEDCTYRIKVLPENYVQLTFYEFDTEGCCDFLYIYKGSAMDNLIARLYSNFYLCYLYNFRISGNKAIGTLYNSSNDNTMTLHFISDVSTVASGFFAIYTSIPSEYLSIADKSTQSSRPIDADCWNKYLSTGCVYRIVWDNRVAKLA
jgi:hypothetical protein